MIRMTDMELLGCCGAAITRKRLASQLPKGLRRWAEAIRSGHSGVERDRSHSGLRGREFVLLRAVGVTLRRIPRPGARAKGDLSPGAHAGAAHQRDPCLALFGV